ncbi:MDR family MFS transporter [Brevibacillus choshinensis]|uniref:MFS transporter n=1 Tax=Brevibacillus choshinensis TaxID=54911 RepID=A0ABX7FL37_BRECH|nr:MFS transporter [Brevibacillus choshinensis]QRG66037.1 MFS transporter [Brevibacillus choshinensis]
MNLMPHSLSRLVAAYPPILWVRLFGETLTSTSSAMIAPFLVLYLSEHIGSSITWTMLIIGLAPFSEILLTLFAGGVTDRFPRKTVMLVSLLMQGLAMLAMAWADTMAAFALLYMLSGAGRSLFIPASRAHLADSITDGQMAGAFALLNTAGSIGAALGPLAGVLIYQYDPALAFLFTAISLLLYAAAVWWKVPHASSATSLESSTAETYAKGSLQTYRPALAIMLLSLPISLFYAQTETNLQLHFKQQIPDYLQALATLVSIKGIMLIILEFWLVKWTQKLPARLLISGSYGCFLIVALGFAFLDSLPALIALQLVWVIGESIGITQLLTFVTRIAPPAMRGRYFAITGTHWDISRTCGPYLGSLLLIHFGGATLFALVAGILLVGGIAMYAYLSRKEKAFPVVQEG